MPATLKGVFHNLKESEYTISNGEIVFFFSSKYYLNKFLGDYDTHREKFNKTTERITIDNPLNMEILADINLYKKIEKRGFYVWLKGVSITWEDLHQYALRKMTEPNTQNWFVIQRPRLKDRFKEVR